MGSLGTEPEHQILSPVLSWAGSEDMLPPSRFPPSVCLSVSSLSSLSLYIYTFYLSHVSTVYLFYLI